MFPAWCWLAIALAADVDALLGEAVDDWNAGKLAEAQALLDQAVKADGTRTDAHLIRGQVRYERGDVSGARKELGEVFAGSGWKTLAAEGRAGGAMAGVEELVWEGAAVLILADIHDNALSAADAVLAQVKAERATAALLAYAEVELLAAHGSLAEARAVLTAAQKQYPGDENLAQAVTDLGAVDWVTAYNTAVDHHNAGRDADCLAAIPSSKDAKVVSLAYTCAVGAKDLRQAEAWLKSAGSAAPLPGSQVLAHALLRSAGGNPSGALDLVRSAKGADVAAQKTLEVRFLGEAGRATEAIGLLGDKNVDAKEAQNLAARLVNAQDYANAKRALAVVCPRLSGSDKAACEDLLAQVNERAP